MGRSAAAFAALTALCVAMPAAPARAEPRAVVEGELPSELKAAIDVAVGETERPIQNRFEARRRAREAGDNATAVLRSEGYYGAGVEPDLSDGDPPRPIVRIEPGTRFVIADPHVAWVGAAPADAVRQAGEAAVRLEAGQPGRAADVIAAEGRVVAAVTARGYADAAADPREVVVDHADHTVRPEFRIRAGELVRLNGLSLVGESRTNRRWLERLAPWTSGDPYDPEDVAELERRLLDTAVYESVTVALAPKDQATAEGLRPVIVSLADRKRRTLELGASYSTSEGTGLDARWTRYNVLGRADTLAILARLADLDSRLAADLTLPHWRRAQQTLTVGADAYQTRTDAYDERGLGGHADVQRRFGKTSYVTVGMALDYSQTDEKQGGLIRSTRNLLIATGLAAVALDRSDDPLDPKRGWRMDGRAEPTLLTGDTTLPYVRTQVQGSLYFPFDDQGRTVVATRLRVGSIVGGALPEVPAPRRFYAGGGGSVRGYAYQAVGPRLADNTPAGGLSLVEGSIELRRKIVGPWGLAAFVDAGAVGSDPTPAFDNLSAGAGLGVRYDLGFGPIRADIAIPISKRSTDAPFQIYLSIGQSF